MRPPRSCGTPKLICRTTSPPPVFSMPVLWGSGRKAMPKASGAAQARARESYCARRRWEKSGVGDAALFRRIARAAQARQATARAPPAAAGAKAGSTSTRSRFPWAAATPASGSGWISTKGYDLRIQGDAELGRLLQVARATGIAGPRFGLFGSAKLDVALSGDWVGFTRPRTFGRAQIRSARAEVPGIASPSA